MVKHKTALKQEYCSLEGVKKFLLLAEIRAAWNSFLNTLN